MQCDVLCLSSSRLTLRASGLAPPAFGRSRSRRPVAFAPSRWPAQTDSDGLALRAGAGPPRRGRRGSGNATAPVLRYSRLERRGRRSAPDLQHGASSFTTPTCPARPLSCPRSRPFSSPRKTEVTSSGSAVHPPSPALRMIRAGVTYVALLRLDALAVDLGVPLASGAFGGGVESVVALDSLERRSGAVVRPNASFHRGCAVGRKEVVVVRPALPLRHRSRGRMSARRIGGGDRTSESGVQTSQWVCLLSLGARRSSLTSREGR